MNGLKKYFFVIIIGACCFALGAFIAEEKNKIDAGDVQHAQKLIGIQFSAAETDSMLALLTDQEKNFENMRNVNLPNSIPPAYNFNPIPSGKMFDKTQLPFKTSDYSKTILPANMNELAYYSIGQLASLVQSKKISSVKLTEFFIEDRKSVV